LEQLVNRGPTSDTSSPKDEWEPDWESEKEGEGESSTKVAAKDPKPVRQADKGGTSEEEAVTGGPKQDESSQNQSALSSGDLTHDPDGLSQPGEGEVSKKTASTKDAAKQTKPNSSQEKDTTQQSQNPSSKNEGDAPQGNPPAALVARTPKKGRGKKKKNKSKKKKPANNPPTPPPAPTNPLSRCSSTSTLDHDG
jgi:hypothetical protein